MKLELINNKGKSWKQFEGNYIKGFAFLNNTLLTESEINNVLIDAIKTDKLKQKLLELNGNFSGVIQFQECIYLFADKLKTYPLLYTNINGEWLITDQSRVIIEAMPGFRLNETAIITYLTLGYLHGEQTFLENCNIVSAGTYVVLNNKPTIHKYHNHIYDKVNLTDDEIMKGCVESMENSIKRMLLSIGDRPIWLPLSGGYDSRLLACLFKKLNVENVKCFTYGIPESYEVKISKQVAKTLGFPWYYVEYTEEKFLSGSNSPMDDDYILWAMNLNTTSHYQDFIAFKELKEKGIIEDNAVIVPGHTGEVLGRDHVPYHLLDENKSVSDLIYYKYFHWNRPKRKYKKQLLNSLGAKLNSTISKENKADAIDLFTNWNIQNRQANFIVNAVRVYEYYGNDWRVPMWDDELSEFWFSLPWEKNSNVMLYNQFMFEQYFIPMGVDIYKESNITKTVISRIKLPFNLKPIIRKALNNTKYFKSRYDVNAFNGLTKFILSKVANFNLDYITLDKTSFNSVTAYYQIYLLKKISENGNRKK